MYGALDVRLFPNKRLNVDLKNIEIWVSHGLNGEDLRFWKSYQVELPFLGPSKILGLVSLKFNFINENPYFILRIRFSAKFYDQIGIIDGTFGQFLGLMGSMYVFSYKNVLFYVGSSFKACSHILVKNMKIKAPKPVLGLLLWD